ncbi:MAG: GIY-YIG nuclease family protein [Thermomicrobiales bacterium]
MSISKTIRMLASDGLSTAEIARRFGIHYQHAYNMQKECGMLPASRPRHSVVADMRTPVAATPKPALSVPTLTGAGFELSGRWILSDSGNLELDRPLANAVGVYAFAEDEIVVYVGVATMGLAKRLYFYGKPGRDQRTNIRINGLLRSELLTVPFIDIYTATPADLEWNGLPVHGSAGLELGLIKKYALPWNSRSASQ